MPSPESDWPDLFGLQEFFVTDVLTETVGRNVRIACGVKRGGSVHWLYSLVMPADMLLVAAQKCVQAAETTFNQTQMPERRDQRHDH